MAALEQYYVQEWKSISSSSATYPEKSTACFDCNICLEFARDPVVTLCGHLYCWPCIYKWMNSQSASLPSGQLPQCPVCKAETCEKAVVPLYGLGQSLSEPQHEGTVIPPRPAGFGIQGLVNHYNPNEQSTNRDSYQNMHSNYNEEGGDLVPSLPNLRGIAPLVLSQPVMDLLGEIVYARVFGSLHTYPNSYHSAGSSTPRLRRRHLHAEKSLNRLTVFFFCCLLLCLFLF